MKGHREYSQRLSAVSRLWASKDYDAALAAVESMRDDWPGNAHLLILWASLVQLQEKATHDLAEAKTSLQQAVAFDKASPAAAIELGNFLDNVEDDPKGASKVFAEAVQTARQLLLEALVGEAKALRQLKKSDDVLRCLEQIIQLARFGKGQPGIKLETPGAGAEKASTSNGLQFAVQFRGPHAEQIEELLSNLITGHDLASH